jgi:pimeloyl-ACP methyl ester carboxylesterase
MPRSYDDETPKTPARLGTGLLTAGLGLVGGWIAYSAFGIDHHLPLPPAIRADQERFVGQVSRFLNVYVDRSGAGRPLVLIHSINAAGSSYEMRPFFDFYRGKRPVYALDLPGFGFSERADRVYSPELYKEAILDLLRLKVKEPADVIALSLGNEFAAQAALERPDLFHSLTMISPSGFSTRSEKRASQRVSEDGTSDVFYKFFSNRLYSQAFYDLLATRTSIRYFLKQSFYGPVDEGLAEYGTLTTHQPGARYAPLYFVSGKLFRPEIRREVYNRLTIPVQVLYDQDAFVSFDLLPQTVSERPNWTATRITPTRGLPQFEKLRETTDALDAFWLSIAD